MVPREDPEVSEVLLKVFRTEGIEVQLGADVQRAEQTTSGVRLEALDVGATFQQVARSLDRRE